MTIWRRKRHAISVISLLTCVFIGVGAVLSILGTSVLRPLPFERPRELFQTIALYEGLPDAWTLDTLERTSALLHGAAVMTRNREDFALIAAVLPVRVVAPPQ